jgi:cytochrome P450
MLSDSFTPAISVQAPINKNGHFLVTRYDDVVMVLKDPRFSNESHKAAGQRDWSKAWWMPDIFRAFLKSMVMIDDPDHARLKNIVHQAFTPRMIQSMEGMIEQKTLELLDKMSKKTNPDLIQDFALPLPIDVISEIMGIPHKNRPEFARLAGKLLQIISATSIAQTLPLLPDALALNSFFKKLIKIRQNDPQDDLITALVKAEAEGERLSEDELIAMLFLLLLAGHETTVNLIGNTTLALLEHPEQFARLKANMGLIDSAIEEGLRFASPTQIVAPRFALEDIDLNGCLIPEGSGLTPWVASANRDEAVFENPHEFNIERNPNKHVAFGFGIHYCLGAPLSRLEGKVALPALFERFPDMQIAGNLRWGKNPAILGLKNFPIRLA